MHVVLLPGMDGTADLFDPFAAAWAGPGELHRVRYEPASPAPYPERPVQLPDGPCVLVAESYSGPIAIHLARAPSVVALVLCCTFVTSPGTPALRAIAGGLSHCPLPMVPPATVVRRVMVGAQAPGSLVAAVQAATARVDPATFRERVRDVLTVDAREALAATTCPLLLLQGEHDRMVPARCIDELHRLRPDAERVVLPGPHLLLQARPIEAATAIARFVAAVAG